MSGRRRRYPTPERQSVSQPAKLRERCGERCIDGFLCTTHKIRIRRTVLPVYEIGEDDIPPPKITVLFVCYAVTLLPLFSDQARFVDGLESASSLQSAIDMSHTAILSFVPCPCPTHTSNAPAPETPTHLAATYVATSELYAIRHDADPS